MHHLRERIGMSTDWFIVLFTSQYSLLDGALIHDTSVYTMHLVPAHTTVLFYVF